MQANQTNLLKFLKESEQFIIPIYQRNYSWDKEQCAKLFSDILSVGENESITAHFIGSIVYITQSIYQVTGNNQLLLIDGQQRLTSIILLLEALSRKLGNDELIRNFSQKYIREYYLVDPRSSGDDSFKILLSKQDKDTLLSLLTNSALPENKSERIKNNFDYFINELNKLDKNKLKCFCIGLSKLIIIDVSLEQGKDNPQLIFESMNSTGKALSQADLVRNYILMGLESSKQNDLYTRYWLPMERSFGQEGYDQYFNSFLRHYLTLKLLRIPKLEDVYEEFKVYASNKNIDELVDDVFKYSEYFSAIALKKEKNKSLYEAFQDLKELKVEVAYPLLLEAYNFYESDFISLDDFCQLIRLIESYIFRRSVCEIPTNSLNKTFVSLIKHKPENYIEQISVELEALSSYRRFPSDEEFSNKIKTRDLYNFRNKFYWLRRFENYERKERVQVSEYTIEHILPQNENLSEEWIEELGSNWKEIQQKYLHTLGNLTLTGYNSEYSDKPYSEKRTMENGFVNSPLRLNQELRVIEKWNETSIQKRAKKLAKQALKIWEKPKLSIELLEKYKSRNQDSFNEDVLFSDKSEIIVDLFEKLKRNILDLDPNITVEYLKIYIAFKAETNFVDVSVYKSKLDLILNMPFILLDDPQNIAKDVTNIGHWGNGNIKIEISQENNSDEYFSYVLGLIKQSLNYQLGNG